MASEISHSIAKMGARKAVMKADELILMIIAAVKQPENGNQAVIRQNERNHRNCMLINKQWHAWAEGFLWKHLSRPHRAFDAVLRQFDAPVGRTYTVAEPDLILRRPREAYVRFCHYVAMVESIDNYTPDQQEDSQLFSKLDLFDLKRDVFLRLTKVTLHPKHDEFWFPWAFRTHAIKDLCIERACIPRGSIRDVSKYCTKLERFVILGRLDDSDLDHLQVHNFLFLTSLSIHLDNADLDNTLQSILSMSQHLTELTLVFHGNITPTTARRGNSFKALKTLRLEGISSIARSLGKLPTALNLESLIVTGCYSDMQSKASMQSLFRAVEEYHNRSPFTTLSIAGVNILAEEDISINAIDLFSMRHLTNLSFVIGLSAGLSFPQTLGHAVWQQLRTLVLVLGNDTYPVLTLGDLFRLVSHAPQLRSVTARVDLRMQSNPLLVSQQNPPRQGYDDVPQTAPAPYALRQDITQYRTKSLRVVDFRSSFLLDYDQLFLFTILRELAPNVRLSTRMLGTLLWNNKETGKAAITYVKRTRPSVSDFIVFLSQRRLLSP